MGNEKNHLYSDADVTFDSKNKLKVNSQQQFSRFSASSDSTIIDIANRSQNPSLQQLTQPQIGDPYNDTFGTIGLLTQGVFFDVYGTEYSFFEVNGDVDFAFLEIPQGRFVEFTLDIVVNTGGPSVTLNFLQVLNPPVLDGNDGDHYILKFVGANRADDTGVDPLGAQTFEYIGGTFVAGGGGGVSFPIDFPEDDRGTVGASTQNILFTASTRHSVRMVVSGDVDLAFSVPPTNETAYSNIILIQDGTGGHIITLPAGTVNKDTVEAGILTGVDEETGIVIKFAFGIFYAFLETGNIVNGGFAFSGNLSDLVIDVNKDWLAQGISNIGTITGVTALDMVGATPTIQGVTNINFAGVTSTIQFLANINFLETNQSINSLATGLDYKVDALQDHTFRSVNGDFLALAEVNATDRRLDIKQNRIVNTGKMMFSPTFDLDTAATAEIYETLTLGNLRYVSNNAHVFVQEGIPTLLSIGNFAGNGGFVQDIALLNFNSLTGEFMINNGDFQLDGIDMKVMSGAAVRNLSNIPTGTPATTELDNLTTPSINAALIPDTAVTHNLGSLSLPWRDIFAGLFVLPVTTIGPDALSKTQISRTGGNHMAFNVDTIGAKFQWYFQGVNTWELSNLLLTGANIILSNSFVINDSSTDPVGNGEFSRNGNVLGLEIPEFSVRRTITGALGFANMNIVKVDDTPSGGDPIGELNFQVDDVGLITYTSILSKIKSPTNAGILELNVLVDDIPNVNALTIEGDLSTPNRTFVSLNTESRIGSDLKFQVTAGSTDLKIFPAQNMLGIVVQDNNPFTVGDNGMLAMPSIILPAVKTRTNMDAALGTHKGAFGFDEGLLIRLWIRHNSGSWYGFDFDASVTTG